MKKIIFEVIVCMLLIGTCFVVTLDTVSADQEGDYTYTVSNGEATITGYTGAGGAITIPSTLGGYATIYIGDHAFYFCDSLTSVTIPNSVTSILDYAFQGCSSLTSVTIPNSVTTIGNHTFKQCAQLASVIIPNSVTDIGVNAFVSCTSLTSVTIPNGVTVIDEWTFSGCTSLASVTIGNSVTQISNYAFQGCESLISIAFLGLVAPITVDYRWIFATPAEILGHAYADSNFPAPGGVWNGLTMGAVIVDENELPVASFTWTPSTPKANQTITFDASGSSDSDGSITTYEWDWNNDGTYESSYTTPTTTHSWTQAGSYPLTVRVTDNSGGTKTKTTTVTVSSSAGNEDTGSKGTPGFELILVLGAVTVITMLWKKKKIE